MRWEEFSRDRTNSRGLRPISIIPLTVSGGGTENQQRETMTTCPNAEPRKPTTRELVRMGPNPGANAVVCSPALRNKKVSKVLRTMHCLLSSFPAAVRLTDVEFFAAVDYVILRTTSSVSAAFAFRATALCRRSSMPGPASVCE